MIHILWRRTYEKKRKKALLGLLTDLRLRVIDKINKKTQFKGLEEEHEIDIDKVKYEIVKIINIMSFLYLQEFSL